MTIKPADTVDLLEDALSSLPCERKKMFGCPVYFANDALFCGVHHCDIFLRLSDGDRREHPEALPFEPLPGRRMREYVVLPAPLLLEGSVLLRWLTCAHGYVSCLPPKAQRGAKRGRG